MAQRTHNLNPRERRHLRVRKKVFGTTERPRLSVFRSSEHIYAQVIDDADGRTLAAASSVEKDVREQRSGKKKTDVAQIVGKRLAERAKAQGVEQVVFDRGGFRYHGRVKAVADGAREGGLSF